VVDLLLFTALTIADGVAVSLFARRIGAARLPGWYSITAVLRLVMISAYLTQAMRHGGGRVFGWFHRRQAIVASRRPYSGRR
jgi:hypothetical protein